MSQLPELVSHPGYEPTLESALRTMQRDLDYAMEGGVFGLLALATVFVFPILAVWRIVGHRTALAATAFFLWLLIVGAWFVYYRLGLSHRWADMEPGNALTLLFGAGALVAWALLLGSFRREQT